jgi:cysteine desulfurase
MNEMEYDHQHIKYLFEGLEKNIDKIVLNGDRELGFPGILNISFSFVEGESLIMALNKISLSSGSACTSASLEPSYVLRALGVEEELAHTSLRFGIGRFTTEKEIDFVIQECTTQVERLRELSPLYEMYKEGIDLKKIKFLI